MIAIQPWDAVFFCRTSSSNLSSLALWRCYHTQFVTILSTSFHFLPSAALCMIKSLFPRNKHKNWVCTAKTRQQFSFIGVTLITEQSTVTFMAAFQGRFPSATVSPKMHMTMSGWMLVITRSWIDPRTIQQLRMSTKRSTEVEKGTSGQYWCGCLCQKKKADDSEE